MDTNEKLGLSVIKLSHFTKALIEKLGAIPAKKLPGEYSRLTVSQTVSFFALAYEKIRNAVEYRETHLIKRAVIERILKRRLLLNPEGTGEGENLVRELLWARYFPPDNLGNEDVISTQSIIDKYLQLIKKNPKHSEFLFELLTCEIEETLSPEEAQRNATQTFFIFQVLKNKLEIEHVPEDQKNAYFYVALEKIYNKSDRPYLRYHLHNLSNLSLSGLDDAQIKKIDDLINNPYSDRIRRFIKNHIPPFKFLFETLKIKDQDKETILGSREILWQHVERIGQKKNDETADKLRGLAIKAIVYIFLTKMIFALILEYPLSLYLYHEVNFTALTINGLFPPLLMFLIVGLTRVPGSDNTKRVYDRLIDIIDADKSFETSVSYIVRKNRSRRPTLVFTFTIIYVLTFFITFFLLYQILSLLNFNIISKMIFVFFVSLVAFFAYRIRQVAKEYRLQEKESFFRPFTDFFFLPFLSVGKFLSRGLARLNFLTAILDFLIEAPFKLIIEVVEEWINFVRARREEIV